MLGLRIFIFLDPFLLFGWFSLLQLLFRLDAGVRLVVLAVAVHHGPVAAARFWGLAWPGRQPLTTRGRAGGGPLHPGVLLRVGVGCDLPGPADRQQLVQQGRHPGLVEILVNPAHTHNIGYYTL